MRNLFRDLLYGLRMLRKSPGFTLVAVLTLALGVGANTAIFQLIDAVRLRTLPVKDPRGLVGVQLADLSKARGNFSSDYPIVTNAVWEQVRDRQEAFEGVFAWGPDTLNLSRGGEARLARATWVSGDFFKVLGVGAERGRVLTPADGVESMLIDTVRDWQAATPASVMAARARRPPLRDRRRHPRELLRDGGRPLLRRGPAALRGAPARRREQPAQLGHLLVADRRRKAQARLD